MITLPEAVLAPIDAGRSLVVPDSRRASAVRLAYACVQAARGRTLWRTPDVLPWAGWLDREAAAASADGVHLPRVMGGTEAWLIWRHCALDGARASGLAVSDALIDGLRRAADLAAEWGIPIDAIARGAHAECVWLARTIRAFATRCRDLDAVPLTRLATLLDRARTSPVHLAGVSMLTPVQRELVERSLARGSDIGVVAPDGAPAKASIARTADASDELAWAAEWARHRLLEDPRRRLLIVVPSLEAARPAIARLFAGSLPTFEIEGGERLASAPLVRHAITSLRFTLAPLEFDVFSAWLRSPFWQQPDPASRARLDLWLRRLLEVRVNWGQLAERLAQPPSGLQGAATEIRRRTDLFVAALDGRPARSNLWGERFLAAFSALGFPGEARGAAPLESHVRFREILNEFAELDLALGELTREEAIDWLDRLVDRASFDTALLDPAVTVSDARADPIVRYDGIWVTNLTAENWPAPVRRDPFIPVHAQLAADLPAASAAGQLAQGRALLAMWRGRADELVLSWPSSADDCEQTPSVLLGQLEDARLYVRGTGRATPAQTVFAARAIESFEDRDGEPWPAATFLPGGSRSVEHQIACAFRAYSELRLRATPLERPRLGLEPRERGRLMHRSLELTWNELRDSARLLAFSAEALDRLIGRAVERAAAELLAEDPGKARERALRRERRRVERVVASLCALEGKRAPFSVIERETRRTLAIEGARLNVRIDRIDRLEDGRLALIDYKTGEPRTPDWLTDRPARPQLLVYLRAVEGEVAALATAHLATGHVAFRGIGDRPERLPKVPGLDPDAWPRQVATWKRLVDGAVRDFAAGHALRDPTEGACVYCHLHALCRIGDATA